MITYYTINPDGSIAASADFKFAADCKQIEKEIVRGYDGKLYFAGEAPDKPQELAAKEREAAFDAAVTARLDAFALENGWHNIDRALSQSGMFKADAGVAQAAYDATWAAAFELMPQVTSGALSIDNAVAQLPALAWPGV